MAQLKDSVVSGNLRVTDSTLTDTLQTTIIKARTSSTGTTYGPGENGQVLKSNGTNVYWASDNNANYYHKTGTWNGLTYTAAKVGSPEDLAFTIPTGTTATTVALGNHHHTLSIAADSSGTNQITLVAATKYKLTAGESTYIFTTPKEIRQSSTTTSNYRPILSGATNTTTVADLAATIVGEAYATTGFYMQPSTGNVFIASNAFGTQLTVERTGSTNMASVGFKNSNGMLGYISANEVDGDLYHYGADTSKKYNILDSHNYTSYTYSSTASRTANTVLAAPNGSNGAATFRKLVAADIPDLSGAYLPLSGGTMSGTITHPANTVAINLRDDGTSTWQNTIMTQSTGDEAVVFANANARTSWMFVNGEDSIAHPESDRWQSLTPALQIKGGCVAIGKLIPHGTTPTTKLDVAGDASISGTLYIDSKVAARHTATPVDGRIMIADGTTGGIKSSSYSIATSVPSGAVFTDTHVKVTSNTSTKAYLIATTTSPAGTAVEGVGDANVYLAGTNHVLYTPGFSTTGSNKGYRAYDQASTQYAIIYDNGSNLWVGAEASNVYHHKGHTYISSGWTGTLPTSEGSLTGNSTIHVSVPVYTVAAGATTGTWNHTPYDVLHSGNTSFTRSLTSGTKIGTITINGTATDIYCQTNTNTDTKVYQSSTTTSDFRPVLFGKNNQTNPENLETAVTDQAFVTKHIFAQPSTGNLNLYSASGDSPALVFRRGTLIDNLNDWKIYVSSGALYFDQSTANASSETWTHKMYLHASDGKLYVGSSAVSVEGHTHNYAGSSSAGGAATSANKLNTNAGSTTNPVYFTNGVPTACNKSASSTYHTFVPSVDSSGVMEVGAYIDFHSKTSTNDFDLRLEETSTNMMSLKNSSPTFRIHSTSHTNAALELWREGNDYTDYRIINTGGQFKIQSDYIEGTGHTDEWFDMLHLAYSTGNATFKGTINAPGGTLSGQLIMSGGLIALNGYDIQLKTSGSSSDDSGDIIWYYGNGKEKMRIWSDNTYSAKKGPNFRVYKSDETLLFNGTLSLSDHTHSLSIATDSGTNALTMAANTKYKITAGGSTFIFTTPPDSNTDTKVNVSLATTTKAYLLGTSTTPTSSAQAVTSVADTGVYLGTTAGSLYATSLYGEINVTAETTDSVSYGLVYAMNPATTQPNTLRKNSNAMIAFKNGTASEEGWAQITLGNGTASGTAGNSTGWLKLFSPSSGYHYITGASTTSAITHTLPAVSGTVLNTGNYLQYMRSIQKLYAATTTKGWRRILSIPASNSSGFTIGRYEFHFTRQWNNGAPESFGVRVICNYTTPIIRLLYANQNSRILTDFRVTRSSDSTRIHFEVWYDSTSKNDFSVRYVIQDPWPIPHDYSTFPTETDGSSAGTSFLPVVSDNPTGQATIPIPTGDISQFNLKQAADFKSGYYGMADGVGSDSAAIRTTSAGLLPYEASNATDGGVCNIGTSGWYFKEAYVGKVVSNTGDFECFQARHSNEFNMKQISSTYIWFNYRLVTDDKQGYTTNPTNPISEYYFGCGKARDAFAKVVTSGMTVYPNGANSGAYKTTLQSASLTANRTATLPNATGTIPLITEKYNSPTSTATSYNLTYATSFKLLMITTKPSSSLFGETTVIVPAPTAAGTTKTYVNWPGVNAEAASQPTRTLGGNIRIRYTNNDTCTIDCVLADYYMQAGASVSSGSTSGFSVYITRVIGISY